MKALAAASLLLLLPGCGRRDEEELRRRLERHLKRAVTLEEQGRIDPAIAEVRSCLSLVGTRERWKTLAVEWRGLIRQLEDQKAEIGGLTARYERWRARSARGDASDRETLLRDGADLLSGSERWSLEWRPELFAALQKIQYPVDKP